MSAPVLKHHRSLAYACVWSDRPHAHEQRWIDEGGGVGAGDERMKRVAQALADIEAKAAHRAWERGYRAGKSDGRGGHLENEAGTENPYPETEQ